MMTCLADVEAMSHQEVNTLGNWSFLQIVDHLTKSIQTMIDGTDFSYPAPMQWLMRLLMKKRMLTKTISPGFQLPEKLKGVLPSEGEWNMQETLDKFREAIQRAKEESHRSPHGGFGKLTREEWDQFQLRHCEMHLSFVRPGHQSDQGK